MNLKILIYDIENSPNISYTWPGSMHEQNVIDIKENWQLLSVAYKWLGEKEVHCISKQGHKSDKDLVKKVHKLFDEADVIVAHNAVMFDNKKCRAKFLEHGLPPPSPYKTIDTLQISRERFSLNSHKLDDLGKLLGVGRKIKIQEGFELWLDVMADKPEAWTKMIAYNKQDVVLLEKVYLKLRPWMDRHPHVGLGGDGKRCPKCGGTQLQSRGQRRTIQGFYNRYQCQSCGGWSTDRLKIENSPSAKLTNPG